LSTGLKGQQAREGTADALQFLSQFGTAPRNQPRPRQQIFGPAVDLLRQATQLEEELGKLPGPLSSFKPTHELFGEVLLAANRPAEAVV
jgi:hypothetical protein